ncbi:hypothetical protein [Aquitalea palustris]|uniref:hypothetical protein n=1 Tax=Aquitalea palustris TaxID=2480983 RepID=UPI001CF0B8CF|nr:hypothetical protein [Aquitalea palustris]
MAVRETLHNISFGALIGWVGGAVLAAVAMSASYAQKAASYYIPLWLQAVIMAIFLVLAIVAIKKRKYTALRMASQFVIVACLALGAYFAVQHSVRENEEAATPGTVGHTIQRILPVNL